MFDKKIINKLDEINGKLNKKTKIINNFSDLEQAILLAKKHRVDLLEIEGYKILISKHEYPEIKQAPEPSKTQDELDDELLYYSAQ
jgi:hypothetical protein